MALRGVAKSGNDVRRDLVFDEGDAVAQLQFAFLQPLQPQQIRRRRLVQGIDRRVEIAVLLLQPGELGFEFALIFVGHGVLNANADENANRLRKPSREYPPWQPGPQASSREAARAKFGAPGCRTPAGSLLTIRYR